MEAYLGDIEIFAGYFAPPGWEICDGRLLSVGEYPLLFAIIEFTFGGDGAANFALPDLRGRISIGVGQGPGLPAYALGEKAGNVTLGLTDFTLPAHSHTMIASANQPDQNTAAGGILASNTRTTVPPMPNIYAAAIVNKVPMETSTNQVGQGTPVSLLQPVLTLNYIICLDGIIPVNTVMGL